MIRSNLRHVHPRTHGAIMKKYHPLQSAFFVLILLLFPCLTRADGTDHRLDFYFIDTEGGASTLIVTPAGESLLVDTGNPGTRDPGRIVTAAKDAGLTKI